MATRQAAIRFDDETATWGEIVETFDSDVSDSWATVERYQARGLEIVCCDEQDGDVLVGDRARVNSSGMIKRVERSAP